MNNVALYFLAILVAFGVAWFTYASKRKKIEKANIVLFVLRFFSVLLLLLLGINPKITQIESEIIKPNLVVLTDNSQSIKNLKQEKQVLSIVEVIKHNKKLHEKFDVDYYSFAKDISIDDSLHFNRSHTDIHTSLKSYDVIYKNKIAPSLLISDGNQTIGNEYATTKLHQKTYPIIIGDTIQHQDIFISQLNVNKYAYLKNKFPVELFVNYLGNKSVKSKLTVFEGNRSIYSNNISLDKNNTSKKIEFFIEANKVGIQTYKVVVSALKNENNKRNNKKDFNVEIIDEQSEILLISDILHPDIAMFKRSIESNKQRKITILKPLEVKELIKYPLIILYQPNANFETIFDKLKRTKNNLFIITGAQTDWIFLNKKQTFFSKKAIQNKENYQATYNPDYTTFLVDDLGFSTFQPLTDFYGKVDFKVPFQSILYQSVSGFNSEYPLLATFEQNNRRGAVLLGENSWRWRMTSKMEENSFQPFDGFINTLVQYLSSNKRTELLETFNKSIYYENEIVKIKAKFYDANYVFNPNGKLWIKLTHKKTKKQLKYPFALKDNQYEVQISDVKKGDYTYTVFDELAKSKTYGSFKVLDYNLEQQFSNANVKDLEKLANANGGKVSYPDKIENLIDALIENKEYLAIQKSKEIKKSIIDWQWILGLIVLLFSIEWFLRKYRGYI